MAFIYDLTDTWNAGGTTFNGIKMNVTDSASAAASKLITLQVGGAERFGVDKAGIGTFASVVRAAAGSTSAPAFSFGSDTNTGMWSPSSDAIAFSTAGSERLRVDSSGNVGIGIAPSGFRLQVEANTNGNDGAFIRNSNTGATAAGSMSVASPVGSIIMRAHSAAHSVWPNSTLIFSDSAFTGGLNLFQNGANPIIAWTNGSERMRITAAGDVGIGTSSPTAKLDVNNGANTEMRLSTSGSGHLQFGQFTNGAFIGTSSTDATAGVMRFGTGGTERMRITSGGNLLVGTVNTAYFASGRGNITVNGATSALYGLRVADVEAGYLFADTDGVEVGAPSAKVIRFNIAGERMRLNSAGNLGLGVTPPSNDFTGVLQVRYVGHGLTGRGTNDLVLSMNANHNGGGWQYGNTGAPASLYIQNTGDHIWASAPSGTAGNAITFTQAMTLSTSAELILDSGTGGGRLTFVPGSASNNLLSTTTGFGAYNPTRVIASDIRFETGSSPSERMRLDSSGNLLVGTTSAGGVEGATIYGDGRFFFDCNTTGSSIIKNNSTTAGASAMDLWRAITTGDPVFTYFGTEASFTTRGSISYNRGGGVVAYNTTSDYRAKDVLGPVENPGATLDALKVYTGIMKGATIARPMLVAHEAQEVVPYAVTGEKDAVNEDGTDKYQQMDHQVLIPLLIAEIQSLRARVAQLEGN